MDKPKLHVSIIPTYLCNYNCEYCYLGELRKNKEILSLSNLKYKINELSNCFNIENVVVYGGEISLLDESYIQSLVKIIKPYNISFVSNISNDWIIDFCDANNIHLSISLNEERDNYQTTLNKLQSLNYKNNKELSVVVLPSLLNKNPKDLLEFYDKIGLDVFFIRYHPSSLSSTNYQLSANDYSTFLKNIIEEKHKNNYNINITNEYILKNNDYNPRMSGFVFINPDGDYMSVNYNKDIESFISFKDLNDWKKYCNKEYEKYFNKCMLCDLFDKCKAEHLIFDEECSGLYNLVKWYQNNV